MNFHENGRIITGKCKETRIRGGKKKYVKGLEILTKQYSI